MKKTLTFLTLVLILNISVFSQTEIVLGDAFNDGLEKFTHFGKVDSITETNYNVKVLNGLINKGTEDYNRAKVIVKFDKNGNVIELNDYISIDDQGNTYRYKYDKKNRLTERIVTDNKNVNVGKLKIKYISDSLIETSHFDSDQNDPVTKWVFEFNKLNMTVTEKRSFPIDSLIYKIFKLGTNNKMIQKEDEYEEWNYKYNSKGELTDVEIIPLIQIDDGNSESGNSKIVYTYDNYSNIIMILKISGSTKSYTKYEYTFDEKNNWIKRIEFENNTPIKLTERKIKYKK